MSPDSGGGRGRREGEGGREREEGRERGLES